MKQRKIISAVNALSRLGVISLPVRVSYEIFKLRKLLEPHYLFELEQEKKLLNDLNGQINEEGMIIFPEEENALRFSMAISEMNDMEIDIEYESVCVRLDDLQNCRIMPDDIEALQPFVVFE